MSTKPDRSNAALIVVDMQRDFMTKGALPVSIPAPETIVPVINNLIRHGGYKCIVFTQDFHPANHCSFAKNLGIQEFSMGKTARGNDQMGWPVHCVEGTPGAKFTEGLDIGLADCFVRKGKNPEFDSYSGFKDQGGHETGLEKFLREKHGITETDVVGVATDYCVAATAIHSAEAGFNTRVIVNACAGVADKTIGQALGNMALAGVDLVNVARPEIASGPEVELTP